MLRDFTNRKMPYSIHDQRRQRSATYPLNWLVLGTLWMFANLKQRLWSDWPDVQTDSIFCCEYMSIGTMEQLKCWCKEKACLNLDCLLMTCLLNNLLPGPTTEIYILQLLILAAPQHHQQMIKRELIPIS